MIRRHPYYGLLFLCILVTFLPRNVSSGTLSEDEQLIAVGVGAFNDGLYDIAEKNLSDFIKAYPQHKKFYDASYLLGRTYLMNGKLREARTSFSRILQDNKFENLDSCAFLVRRDRNPVRPSGGRAKGLCHPGPKIPKI